MEDGLEEEGVAGVAMGVRGDAEYFPDVFREPWFAAGFGGDEGVVHAAEDEVGCGFEEEFEPALDVDGAVLGRLWGRCGDFREEDVEPEGVAAFDL